jgi:NAD(P) transhydrogenase subunit beta
MIIAGLAIGGGAGAYIARKIAMTSMPQLVAGFHSLVGLAAVLVAAAALYSPHAFGIGEVGEIHAQALIEMSLGVAIGAITFTGSIIAFLKLDGRMSGKPIMLPMRHVINGAWHRHRRPDRRARCDRKLHGVLADRRPVAGRWVC